MTSLPKELYLEIGMYLDTVDLFMISMTCKLFEDFRRPTHLRDKCRSILFPKYPQGENHLISYAKIINDNLFNKTLLPKQVSMKYLLDQFYLNKSYTFRRVLFIKLFLENRTDEEIIEHLFVPENKGVIIPYISLPCFCVIKTNMSAYLFAYLYCHNWIYDEHFYSLNQPQMREMIRLFPDKKYNSYIGLCNWLMNIPFEEELFDLILACSSLRKVKLWVSEFGFDRLGPQKIKYFSANNINIKVLGIFDSTI